MYCPWFQVLVEANGMHAFVAQCSTAAAPVPVLLLPTHKTHIDYLVMSYLLVTYGMKVHDVRDMLICILYCFNCA
jgi:glycerol-3-phosphate O-acyltransferase